jgi:hypothetical protein
VPDLEDDVAEREPLAVRKRLHREVGPRCAAVGDGGARGRSQLEVAREEVGVEVGLDHPLDRQPESLGVGEIARDVALRVDDDRPSRPLVSDQVAEQRQAAELVLPEDHAGLLLGYLDPRWSSPQHEASSRRIQPAGV